MKEKIVLSVIVFNILYSIVGVILIISGILDILSKLSLITQIKITVFMTIASLIIIALFVYKIKDTEDDYRRRY